MLTIRESQMEAFREELRRAFCRDVAAGLRREEPELAASLSEETLLERIRAAVDQAPRYNLFGPEEVRQFARFVARHGAGFAERPETAWAAALLNDVRTSVSKKLETLRHDGVKGR